MLGISDFSVALVYILCILSALLCLVYGIINWNKGEPDIQDISKATQWEEEEVHIEEKM